MVISFMSSSISIGLFITGINLSFIQFYQPPDENELTGPRKNQCQPCYTAIGPNGW